VDRDRIAKLIGATPAAMARHPGQMPWRFVLGYLNPRSLTGKAFGNPRLLGLMNSYNREDVQRVEIPAANGIGQVRSIAAAYGEFACGGERLGLSPSTLTELRQAAAAPSGGRRDLVLGVDTAFSFGYLKPFPSFRFGGERGAAFGTPGAGGSFGFADPETGIGYGYAPNRAGLRIVDDPREVALRDALFRLLGGPPQKPDSRHRLWGRPSSV
jgi:CubicO group peptidase (beta-lactamase class C family)